VSDGYVGILSLLTLIAQLLDIAFLMSNHFKKEGGQTLDRKLGEGHPDTLYQEFNK